MASFEGELGPPRHVLAKRGCARRTAAASAAASSVALSGTTGGGAMTAVGDAASVHSVPGGADATWRTHMSLGFKPDNGGLIRSMD